jgi:hypothetical protein
LRENNYNTGLRGVLFDAEHYARMGPAVWLYGWLILRQTHQTGTIGWVLGGAPIHYREIEEETGFNRRTLERWMKMLRRQKYIETAVVESGITIRILKAKKHLHRNLEAKPVRRTAGGVRRAAESIPQKCVATGSERYSGQRLTNGIGSSSVVRIKEKEAGEIHQAVEREENSARELVCITARQETVSQVTEKADQNQILQDSWLGQNQDRSENQNEVSASGPCPLLYKYGRDADPSATQQSDLATPTQTHSQTRTQLQTQTHNHRPMERESARPSPQQNFSWDLRERMRLIRAERDEAVRRELFVGSGPEVGRR